MTNGYSCINIIIPIENKGTNIIWIGCTLPFVCHLIKW